MSFNVKPEQEISFSSSLIPEGALVECIIAGSDAPKKSQSTDNYSLNWELVVARGQYKDSKLYDNIGTAGQERYVTLGKMKMSYALEINRQSHTSGNYDIENHQIFNGMKVVIKVGVEIKQGKNGKLFYANKALAYASPRQDSRNFNLWDDYVNGKQPYQTDVLPPLPKTITNGSYSQPISGHPAFDDIPL